MRRPRLLLIDDDLRISASLANYLRDCNFDVVTAADCGEARRLNNSGFDLSLIDLMLPDGSGLELLTEFREQYPRQAAVMISGQATLADAVTAVKSGAADFLEKPLSPEKVEITLRNALRLQSLERHWETETELLAERYALIGESPEMQQVREQIRAVSGTDSTVMLLGESGTGKEVASRLIHVSSPRRQQPFVAVNSAAVPSELLESEMFGHEKGAFTGATRRRIGRFEQASGGTLFLDEIAEMPASLQVKLLRVLEERQIERVGGDRTIEIDLRLICATNREPAIEVREGRLRQDLYFRLNVFTITLPPLRQIREDIPLIARHHFTLLARRMGRTTVALGEDLLKHLQKYYFPGNVRELRNILEHLLITHGSGVIGAEAVKVLLQSSTATQPLSLGDATAQFEREYIAQVLRKTAGNISEAANHLGLDRSYLYRKMRALGLDEPGT